MEIVKCSDWVWYDPENTKISEIVIKGEFAEEEYSIIEKDFWFSLLHIKIKCYILVYYF